MLREMEEEERKGGRRTLGDVDDTQAEAAREDAGGGLGVRVVQEGCVEELWWRRCIRGNFNSKWAF